MPYWIPKAGIHLQNLASERRAKDSALEVQRLGSMCKILWACTLMLLLALLAVSGGGSCTISR